MGTFGTRVPPDSDQDRFMEVALGSLWLTVCAVAYLSITFWNWKGAVRLDD